MLIAEIKGKLSSRTERMEDILTSNVFSFLKYADRAIFLKSFLDILNINLDDNELKKAEFIFWPCFEDYTEPDVVVIAGNYYILFEAKLYSGFGKESQTTKAQLIREIEGGLIEAKNLKKEFVLVALTEDYYFKKDKFKDIEKYKTFLKWTNWQSISEMLLKLIEMNNESLPNYLFAKDLYDLLDKKNLRAFRPFDSITYNQVDYFYEELFLPLKATDYAASFLGFKNSLNDIGDIIQLRGSVFYNKKYFKGINLLDVKEIKNSIFYHLEGQNE